MLTVIHKCNVVYKQKGKKRVKVLYMKILRAIYGCLESVLLWCQLYSSMLQKIGFELNEYMMCIVNKTIEGSQYTDVFYVDDNKISHKNPKVFDSIITALEKSFGGINYSRGKHRDFLGMDIEYNYD